MTTDRTCFTCTSICGTEYAEACIAEGHKLWRGEKRCPSMDNGKCGSPHFVFWRPKQTKTCKTCRYGGVNCYAIVGGCDEIERYGKWQPIPDKCADCDHEFKTKFEPFKLEYEIINKPQGLDVLKNIQKIPIHSSLRKSLIEQLKDRGVEND